MSKAVHDGYIDQFLAEWQARGKSSHTLRLYRKVLRAFAAWLGLDDLDVEAFTPAVLESYRQHLRDRGLRPQSITNYFSVLRVYAGWLGVAVGDFDWRPASPGNPDHCGNRVLVDWLWRELVRRGWTVADLSQHTGLPVRRIMAALGGQRVEEAERTRLVRVLSGHDQVGETGCVQLVQDLGRDPAPAESTALAIALVALLRQALPPTVLDEQIALAVRECLAAIARCIPEVDSPGNSWDSR